MKRFALTLSLAIMVLVSLLSISTQSRGQNPLRVGANEASAARICSRYASWWSYTFERGSNSGRIPGHVVLAFRNPLPGRYWFTGGKADLWKSNERGYALFLTNGIPYFVKMNWNC